MKDWNEIIRQKLSQEEFPFQEEHWDELEPRLPRRRRTFLPWSMAAGIILLLGVFWWTKPFVKLPQKAETAPPTSADRRDSRTAADARTRSTQAPPYSEASKRVESSMEMALGKKFEPAAPKPRSSTYQRIVDLETASASTNMASSVQQESPALPYENLHLLAARLPRSSHHLPLPEVQRPSIDLPLMNLPRLSSPRPSRNSFALVAAPDLTSVQGAGSARLSTNLGLLYTYSMNKRWSASAGLLYARKNYTSPYSFYKPDIPNTSSYRPTDVRALCQVLSVPIGINFTALQKKNHTLQLNAGASTYFMLNEKYSMKYTNGNTHEYEFTGENQHYFGVADLSLTYLRRVNSHYSLGIRPFVQLPLQGIGYGNIPLQSQGLALIIGLNR